jgi:alkanesulfonate monooxygenase SsuD/methylene tetrahydromethanopterin reductase-like flavin-dependent oxidoreductase (luciferase family)
MKPLVFGWILPSGPGPAIGRATYVQSVERGLALIQGHFDSAWMVDHLQFEQADLLEGWTALTYFAARTPGLFFGHTVLCQSYRNPALLAKMASTLQYLSAGRYILGLGAGWLEREYQAYNYPFPSGEIRVGQLEETVQIIKALWEQGPATFQGHYYLVTNAYCMPHPDPHPPLLIGAHSPRMLRLVARYADWWDVSLLTPEEYRACVSSIEQACVEVGRDPSTLRRSFWFGLCSCARTEEQAITQAGRRYGKEPGLIGTPQQIVKQMQPYIELGVERFEVGCCGFPDLSSLKLFISEVLPALRV